ncbi:MAG: DUF7931 domain-containing protein [Thiobacillus sp.]
MKPFEIPAEFRAAFDALLDSTQRQLLLYDHDLSLFDIDQLPRHNRLRAICVAGSGRRIELLLDEIHHVARDCPRLMQLVRDFGHVIEIRQADPNMPRPDQAFALADRHGTLVRADKSALHGTLHLDDAHSAIRLHQEFEGMWQRAQASVTATTLGL